jgi:glycyl-tRNA synthetase (class II)
MDRIVKLEKLCHKIGIIKQSSNATTFGPYGYMILEQIRAEWTRINKIKYDNTFMLNGFDLVNTETTNRKKSGHDVNKNSDASFITESLRSNFNLAQLPFGIINVVEKKPEKKEPPFLLFKNLAKETKLRYVYMNDSVDVDTLIYWQTERRRWWSRHLQSSYKIALESVNDAKSSKLKFESSLVYHMAESNQKCTLEKLTYFSDVGASEVSSLVDMFAKFEKPAQVRHKRDLLIAETSCERVLESLLIDSVNEPGGQEYVKQLAQHKVHARANTVFGLDFRLAPLKACILYKNDRSLSVIASDLKKMCYMNNVSVFLMSVESDDSTTLAEKHQHLDEMGVPFCVYLPPRTVKDGICLVRNRDTDISERTHLSLVAKNFKSFSDSLNF